MPGQVLRRVSETDRDKWLLQETLVAVVRALIAGWKMKTPPGGF